MGVARRRKGEATSSRRPKPAKIPTTWKKTVRGCQSMSSLIHSRSTVTLSFSRGHFLAVPVSQTISKTMFFHTIWDHKPKGSFTYKSISILVEWQRHSFISSSHVGLLKPATRGRQRPSDSRDTHWNITSQSHAPATHNSSALFPHVEGKAIYIYI